MRSVACQHILPTCRMADAEAQVVMTQLHLVAAELATVRSQVNDAARELMDAPPDKQAMFQKLYDDLVQIEERLDAKYSMILQALLLGKLPGTRSSIFGHVRAHGSASAAPLPPAVRLGCGAQQ